jgi:hypothetical protein
MSKPNCYDCKHRGTVPGDAHSSCHHPEAGAQDRLTAALAIFMGHDLNPKGTLKVVGNSHGIRNGWFMFPVNFDPTWLESCNGFTSKNKE